MSETASTASPDTISSSLADLGRSTALGLLIATVGSGVVGAELLPIHLDWHEETSALAQTTERVDARSVITALTDLHDRLLAESRELDPQARDVLYENLWDLYAE